MEILNMLITCIATVIISGWLTLKFNYNNLFAENVSKSRMEWINCFREEIATITAVLEIKQAKKLYDEESRYIYEAYKARTKLRTRLNMNTSRYGNEYNETMDDVLASLKFDGKDDVEKTRELLITLSRKILEPEWQKVKNEAKGKEKK